MNFIDDLLHKKSEWLKGNGPKSNIVISSRVRLARNIDGYPFYIRSTAENKKKILDDVRASIESNKIFKEALFISLKDLSDLDRQLLVERHLISPDHMETPEFKAVVVDKEEILSIMVNEEDHLRVQVLKSGFNLMDAWRIVDKIDTVLSEKIQYAFSTKWGYLTACPTNIGTGLRGSVMVHLCALNMTNQVAKVFQAISKLGLTMRGLYGEGTEASGDFFQISNQVTFGRSEEEILGNIERIVNKIIMREMATRSLLLEKKKDEINDKIWRALGTLKSARIISSNEAIMLLSIIRFGIDLGIVKDIDFHVLNELFILIQPAHLQKIAGKLLSPNERDGRRAELLRERLK